MQGAVIVGGVIAVIAIADKLIDEPAIDTLIKMGRFDRE